MCCSVIKVTGVPTVKLNKTISDLQKLKFLLSLAKAALVMLEEPTEPIIKFIFSRIKLKVN